MRDAWSPSGRLKQHWWVQMAHSIHPLDFPREDPKAKRGPSPGQGLQEKVRRAHPTHFADGRARGWGCERRWRPRVAEEKKDRAGLRFGKQVPWVEWPHCVGSTLPGYRARTFSSYTAPAPAGHFNPISTSPTRLGAPQEQGGVWSITSLGYAGRALWSFEEVVWTQLNSVYMEGNRVECGQRFMHKNVHQIHVCKSKNCVDYCWSGWWVQGSIILFNSF